MLAADVSGLVVGIEVAAQAATRARTADGNLVRLSGGLRPQYGARGFFKQTSLHSSASDRKSYPLEHTWC